MLAGLLLVGGSAVGLQAALVFAIGPLFFVTLILTAILGVPVLMHSVLHPKIVVTQGGLTLWPMLWRPQYVPWQAVIGTAPNPLIVNNAVVGRLLHGRHYRPHEGALILLNASARLSPLYRLVLLAASARDEAKSGRPGQPVAYAFAISNTSHTRYADLVATIREKLRD